MDDFFPEVLLTEKVDSKVMASVLFIDFTVVRQSVTLKQTISVSKVNYKQQMWHNDPMSYSNGPYNLKEKNQ